MPLSLSPAAPQSSLTSNATLSGVALTAPTIRLAYTLNVSAFGGSVATANELNGNLTYTRLQIAAALPRTVTVEVRNSTQAGTATTAFVAVTVRDSNYTAILAARTALTTNAVNFTAAPRPRGVLTSSATGTVAVGVVADVSTPRRSALAFRPRLSQPRGLFFSLKVLAPRRVPSAAYPLTPSAAATSFPPSGSRERHGRRRHLRPRRQQGGGCSQPHRAQLRRVVQRCAPRPRRSADADIRHRALCDRDGAAVPAASVTAGHCCHLHHKGQRGLQHGARRFLSLPCILPRCMSLSGARLSSPFGCLIEADTGPLPHSRA